MQICKILTPGLVRTDLQATTKSELFEEMVDMLVAEGRLKDRELALNALIERENKMSTGVAPGFALPHGKLADVKGVVMALGISRKGIEYDSLDGEPVFVVLMLFSEAQNPAPHIEVLSEVGRLLSLDGVMEKIRQASTPQEILMLLESEE